MADENTKIIDPIQAEPAEVNAEIPSVETKAEEVSVVSEAEPIPSTVEPSIQDEVVKVEEKKLDEQPVQEPEVFIETPVIEVKPKEAEIPNTPPPSSPPYRSSTPFASEVQDAQGLALGSQSQAHPLAGEEKTSAPAVVQIPVDEPKLTPVVAPAPEPVTSPHVSPLEALGASFVANMKRARELLVKARATLSLRRKKKIEKIMTLFLRKSKIVNKDVRELLTTTEHTATDYLNALVKEGKIKKEGKSSHAYYTKV